MKSVIGLALIAVLCALGVNAVGIKDPVLTITDKNHATTGDRVLDFECKYTPDSPEAGKPIVVRIYKLKADGTIDGTLPLYVHTVGADAQLNPMDGVITAAQMKADADKNINKFVATNPTAIAGNYKCDIKYDTQIEQPGTKVAVLASAEKVGLTVAIKDAKTDKPAEFGSDGEITGDCAIDVLDNTFGKLEISKDGHVFLKVAADYKTDKGEKAEGLDPADITVSKADDNKKFSFKIVKANDKTAGKFVCKYEVTDKSEKPVLKPIASNEVPLTYVNGAAANVASLSLLVLAVTSYFKLSL